MEFCGILSAYNTHHVFGHYVVDYFYFRFVLFFHFTVVEIIKYLIVYEHLNVSHITLHRSRMIDKFAQSAGFFYEQLDSKCFLFLVQTYIGKPHIIGHWW